jgi:hypothetical protein
MAAEFSSCEFLACEVGSRFVAEMVQNAVNSRFLPRRKGSRSVSSGGPS